MITRLSLQAFRSHPATRLVLDGRPVVFAGANGAGKTNILEAVSLLSPGRGLRRAGPQDFAMTPGPGGWKIAARAFGEGADHDIETWGEGDASRSVRIDDKAATQTDLARILRVLWLVPPMDRLWIEAAEGRRRFLDRMTLSFEPLHAERSLAYERAMRERNRLLKEEVRDPHWYAALEAQMAEAGTLIRAARARTLARLQQAQAGAATAFPQADLTLTGPEGADEPEDLAAALAEGRRRDMAAGRTLVGPHRSDMTAIYAPKGVAADQCSTGEQKALLISLILANARALAEDTGHPPVVLLDEVAAHLDPGRRAALYDEICALCLQAMMTGTESAMFDTLGDRAQRFEVAEAGGVSVVRA